MAYSDRLLAFNHQADSDRHVAEGRVEALPQVTQVVCSRPRSNAWIAKDKREFIPVGFTVSGNNDWFCQDIRQWL
jgi:hypothetical protein